MVWGRQAAAGVDDLCKRLKENDPKLVSLIMLRHRKCGPEASLPECGWQPKVLLFVFLWK